MRSGAFQPAQLPCHISPALTLFRRILHCTASIPHNATPHRTPCTTLVPHHPSPYVTIHGIFIHGLAHTCTCTCQVPVPTPTPVEVQPRIVAAQPQYQFVAAQPLQQQFVAAQPQFAMPQGTMVAAQPTMVAATAPTYVAASAPTFIAAQGPMTYGHGMTKVLGKGL